MISFEYPPGLLLLLAIPLLLLFLRSRSVPRREVLTAFFLLEKLEKPVLSKTLRLFRLRKRHRLGIVALIIACLSLAVSGTAVNYERHAPEKWLLVIDNLPLGLRAFDERTVHDSIRDFVAGRAGTFHEEDLVTVIATSPEPRARTFSPGGELEDHLRSLNVARTFPPVEEAARAASELAEYSDRCIVLSPRSGAWRKTVGTLPNRQKFIIPDDLVAEEGNGGITHGTLRPSRNAEGGYDLFLSVMTSDVNAREMALSAVSGGRALPVPRSVPLREGRGDLFLEGMSLPPGRTVFTLEAEDAFPPDDSYSFRVDDPKRVRLSLRGDSTPVFEAALGTFPLFTVVGPEEGDVDVFLGDSPLLPGRPSLVIFPSRSRSGLAVRGVVDATGGALWHPDHPITYSLPAGSFSPRRLMDLAFDDSFESIATVDGVPALLAGHRNGRRVVVWAFNPLEDELFLKPEFVILLRESVAWLSGQGEDEAFARGTALTGEAREVALPDMREGLFERTHREERTLDLAPLFIVAALLAGLYLGLADSMAGEEAS